MTPQRRRAMLSRLVDTSSSGSTIMVLSTTAQSLLYYDPSSHCSSLASRTIIARAQLAREAWDRLKVVAQLVVDVGLTEFSAGLTTRRCCTGARKPPSAASSAVSFLPPLRINILIF